MSTHLAENGQYKRQARNFLLDARFQLKFASYIVGITLVLSALLGVFLYRTTNNLFAQAQSAVDARSQAANTSRELGTCTLNNDLAKNLDNPEFTKQLQQRSEEIDKTYDAEKNLVIQTKADLVKQQQWTLLGLIGALAAFILIVGLGTIVTTHRIVGPLFRVKRMANEVAAGKINPPTYGLRPGDELKDVFDAFSHMVTSLRERQSADLATIDQAIAAAKANGSSLTTLEQMRAAMQARLDQK
jgi:hypothetical protein